MKCRWKDYDAPDAVGWRRVQCVRCGFVSNKTPHVHAKVFRQCDLMGLGDLVAWLLAKIGITKQRVAALVPSGDCDCDGRQEALNAAGDQLDSVWRRLAAYCKSWFVMLSAKPASPSAS